MYCCCTLPLLLHGTISLTSIYVHYTVLLHVHYTVLLHVHYTVLLHVHYTVLLHVHYTVYCHWTYLIRQIIEWQQKSVF